MRMITDGMIEERIDWVRRSSESWSLELIATLRTLRRERAQLAARVEELEAETQRLRAALDGTLIADGPEAA